MKDEGMRRRTDSPLVTHKGCRYAGAPSFALGEGRGTERTEG